MFSGNVEETVRRVIIESPFKPEGTSARERSEDGRRKQIYARRCLRDSLMRGESPLASHLLYTQEGVLDDAKENERELGIAAGLAWGTAAAATVVYCDLGISHGMVLGIERAMQEKRIVEVRSISDDPWAESRLESAKAKYETKKCDYCDAIGACDTERGGAWVDCSHCDGKGLILKHKGG